VASARRAEPHLHGRLLGHAADQWQLGGAIYTDGAAYDLNVTGTVMRDNTAREGGGGIFFVVNSGGGTPARRGQLHDRVTPQVCAFKARDIS
jgi:hypothetical protein